VEQDNDWGFLRRVSGKSKTWVRIDDALRRGFRGLPGGSPLMELLAVGAKSRP